MTAVASVLAPLARTLAVYVLLFGVPVVAAADETPKVKPQSGPWASGPGFSFERKAKKTRMALSGIACPPTSSGVRRCLVVFDEGGEARTLVLRDDGFTPENEPIELRRGKVELDAEAAATDGTFYYVTGSHSVKRSDCEENPDSRTLMRFRLDPATGQPARTARGALVDFKDTDALWRLMSGLDGLKKHAGECLAGGKGLDIEGLGVRDGRLLVGFRGPAHDGMARILAVDAKAIFEGGDPKPKLMRLRLGEGRGIRDLAPVRDGVLVLAGPNGQKAHQGKPWIVARWDGQNPDAVIEPKRLAELALPKLRAAECAEDIKPEAMAVMEDREGAPYRIVILSDGLCDGGPLAFTIPR